MSAGPLAATPGVGLARAMSSPTTTPAQHATGPGPVVRTTVAGLAVRLVAPAQDVPQASGPGPWQDALPLVDTAAAVSPATAGSAGDPSSDADRQAVALATSAATVLLEVLQRHRRAAGPWLGEQAGGLVAAWARQRSWAGVRVARVLACRTAERAVEASVVLSEGDGHFAVALRLENGNGRWVLTLIEVMLPPAALGMVA